MTAFGRVCLCHLFVGGRKYLEFLALGVIFIILFKIKT